MFSEAVNRALLEGRKMVAIRLLAAERGCSMEEAIELIQKSKAEASQDVVISLPDAEKVPS